MAFCRQEVDTGSKFGPTKSKDSALYCNYMFSAAIYDKECSAYDLAVAVLNDKSHWSHNAYKDYGHAFEKFILENDLGSIVSTPALINRAFHSDHKVKVWIWTVNETNVRNLYAKLKKG